MSERRLYIVEGECEQNFFNACKKGDIVRPGKIVVFNLMQNRLTISNSIVSQKYDVYICCVDTDVVDKVILQNLVFNLKLLGGIGRIKLVVQNKNFEDELLQMAGRSKFDNIAGGCTGHALKKKLVKEKYNWVSKETNLSKYGLEYIGLKKEVDKIIGKSTCLNVEYVVGDKL